MTGWKQAKWVDVADPVEAYGTEDTNAAQRTVGEQ